MCEDREANLRAQQRASIAVDVVALMCRYDDIVVDRPGEICFAYELNQHLNRRGLNIGVKPIGDGIGVEIRIERLALAPPMKPDTMQGDLLHDIGSETVENMADERGQTTKHTDHPDEVGSSRIDQPFGHI